MKIALIDNYDSFTYNLKQYLEEISDAEVHVIRNDEKRVQDLGGYDRFVISPGPGLPQQAGICEELIRTYSGVKPILGVCLGLQAMVTAFGGSLLNLNKVFHGVASGVMILDHSDPLFLGLSSPFDAGRYHSWVADKEDLPDVLKVTATDASDVIMAVSHSSHPTHGVQFHPESILTPDGKAILGNFLNIGQSTVK